MTWRDALDTVHGRAGRAARIVSLVPSITELLFALDLGEQVVGRTTFCVHPADAVDAVPRVGGTKAPRYDRLRALAPTHVIVNIDENTRECADTLAGFVPSVVVTHPCAPRDNLELYRLLGGIFDRETRAATLSAALTDALVALERDASRGPRLRALYLIWRDPWMTVSPPTYIGRTLAAAGIDVVRVDSDARYPEVTRDTLFERPELALLSSEPFPFKPAHAEELRTLLGRRALPVHMIDGEMTSWYGNRAVAGLGYLRDFVQSLRSGAATG